MIEQAYLLDQVYLLSFRESFRKTSKKVENQVKNQIKAIEDHGKQLVESNERIKKDFKIDRDSILHEEQKKYLMNLSQKGLLNFII